MNENEKLDELEVETEQLEECLEKTNLMGSKFVMVKYQNFWCSNVILKDIIHFQTHFKAQDTDIILVSQPKCGTTWLKSLLFTIVNRFNPNHQPLNKNSPLLTHNPHDLVYFLECGVYGGNPPNPTPQQLQQLPSPRLLQTHLPYASLPKSIKTSSWVEEFFDDFCLGKFPFGPYFDHVIEFWKECVQQPDKFLFLKYEDLKGDQAILHLKNLAEFVGFPFSHQEESEGIIDDIVQLCSISNLKELEVNKTGSMLKIVKNENFFRKGEVGDWTNYFTPSMVERINTLMQEHFGDTNLSFQMQ
ncbi:Cytosolic sulfotransferase 15 [Bienertia sinuspersici]